MYRVSLDDALAEDLRQRGLRRPAGFSWTESARTLLAELEAAARRGVSPETLVLVISLADAAERRAGFTERARATTLPWKFFDAHRALGAGLAYHPRRGRGRQGTAAHAGRARLLQQPLPRLAGPAGLAGGADDRARGRHDRGLDLPGEARGRRLPPPLGVAYLRLLPGGPARSGCTAKPSSPSAIWSNTPPMSTAPRYVITRPEPTVRSATAAGCGARWTSSWTAPGTTACPAWPCFRSP